MLSFGKELFSDCWIIFFFGFFCVLRDMSSKMIKWYLIGYEIYKYVLVDVCNYFVFFFVGLDFYCVDSLGKLVLMIGF